MEYKRKNRKVDQSILRMLVSLQKEKLCNHFRLQSFLGIGA